MVGSLGGTDHRPPPRPPTTDHRPPTTDYRQSTMLGPETVFDPGSLLAMWAAGITGAAAIVARWRVVGSGFLWLAVATAGLVGAGAWFFAPGPVTAAAWLVGVGAALAARHSAAAAGILTVSAVLYLAAASSVSLRCSPHRKHRVGRDHRRDAARPLVPRRPRIPRRPLMRLAAAGAVGVLIDAVVVLSLALPRAESSAGMVVSIGLVGASCLLMAAVWFALRHPSYPGVMAATGLSYLAGAHILGSGERATGSGCGRRNAPVGSPEAVCPAACFSR